MNQSLQIFQHDEFGKVRVVMINNEPWFVAVDVCNILEIKNPTDTLKRLDDDERARFNLGRQGETNIVNEFGLYSLVLSSRKPEAKNFKRWITHEVIPSIRKNGFYIPDKIDGDTLMRIAQRMKELEAKNALLTTQIAELKPKVDYYDVVLQCKDLVAISVIAKDYGKSAQEFNKLLYKLGVQFLQGRVWLLYQEYAAYGWTQTTTHCFKTKKGTIHSIVHTYWTPKGRRGLYNLLKNRGILPLIEQEDQFGLTPLEV